MFKALLGANLLPKDGELYYTPELFESEKCDAYFHKLLANIRWEADEVFIFGKQYITKRKVAFYGDKGINYRYSKSTKEALTWTPELLEIKAKVENDTNCSFNACLLNLYHNGSEGMSWHSDNEKELGDNPAIASISFGAPRKFAFKHKLSKERYSLILEGGSLLLMKGEMQDNWLHSIPKTTKIVSPRVNLTFRKIIS